MREERKLNKALRQDGIDTQADILAELKRKYPQYTAPQKSDDTVKRKRIAVFSSLAAVAACVAIIVPCAVLLPNKDVGVKPLYSTYSDSDFNTILSDYTMREYSEMSGGKILYFDWYDTAEEYSTYNYWSDSDGKILGYEETAFLTETEEMVHLVVTETNVYIKNYNYDIDKYTQEYTVDKNVVKWWVNNNDALCMLENDGYRYFIRIEEGQDETRLFELVSELLQKN